MAYTEDLYIFKDTQTLCEKLLEYSRNVSKLIRYGEYSVMISKACQAMDLVRQINSSFEGRDEGITRYILLIAEVKSRINLFARSQFLPLKNATNLGRHTAGRRRRESARARAMEPSATWECRHGM